MCGLAGRLERRQDHSGAAVPSLKRKLPAWNLAQAKLGLAGALKALGKEPARVNTLLKEGSRWRDRVTNRSARRHGRWEDG